MRLFLSCLVATALMTTSARADKAESDEHECALNFEVKNIEGESVDLEDYEGNVVLIVNVASKCGLTPQYENLQAMYEKYKDQGFVILGFPCNQFAGQEPWEESKILEFCTGEYNVSFPMFSKLEVNGDGAAPLYKFLTSQDVKPKGAGKVSWNFEKFLIDREGNLVNRFEPRTKPDDKIVVKAVEAELAKK
ncbi:glutathione peroxidase [Crateriforma conspicua]|uniref:Glutathione peroxidase n=1 Tax=Crateriforma conspicua TaxID=2527996 RepID=A0A5C6G2J8_9PLAN|nr:glutathione peroxidase [Crateriforma conspicua]TWU67403.1 Hydroperoxy fatty acid reductase gpx1 [Crateriforma conspicua]